MADYLQRYQQGEHAQVWKELTALGEKVREEPVYSEAWAVAQETMRRAKHNVIVLARNLRAIEFQFADPDAVFLPTSPAQLEGLAALEREVGPVPLSVRAWIEQVGAVDFRGNYPRLSYFNHKIRPSGTMMTGPPHDPQIVDIVDVDLDSMYEDLASADAMPHHIKDGFMKMEGFFRAFQDQASEGGDTSPSGQNIPAGERVVSDPLVFDLHEFSLDSVEYEEWLAYEGREAYKAYVAPDMAQKSDAMQGEGSVEILLPNPAADAPLLYTDWGDVTFVDYMRLSFEWAGFPGLQKFEHRDEDLLATLKGGLLPL